MSYVKSVYRPFVLVVLACFGLSAPPASSQERAETRLVSCEQGSCLRVQGFRADPAAIVMLNGQVVSVEGRNSWECTVPLDTIRAISGEGDRFIKVSLVAPASHTEVTMSARLPTGLLGQSSKLETIIVRAP